MTPTDLFATLDATWPAAREVQSGPWLIREGRGGGKRVSAATAEGPVTEADLASLEAGQAGLGQPALVMVRAGEDALDTLLEAAGYARIDPVVGYAAPVAQFLEHPFSQLAVMPQWPPLAIADELWEETGIDEGRRAVMARATGPKTALLSRIGDKPAGIAFVAVHDKTAMIHAIEVREPLRRQGAARKIMMAAAKWSQDIGVSTISLLVTERNSAARALYTSFGMDVVGQYHYRMR